jgi:hypothetical protein
MIRSNSLLTRFTFPVDNYLEMLRVRDTQTELLFAHGIECEAFICFLGEHWELKFKLSVHDENRA